VSNTHTNTDISYKILFHHHTTAFEEDGNLWVQSFIGQWIDDLSTHFEAVGLLLYISESKLPQHDYCINSKNVSLVSLGHSRIGHWLHKVIDLRSKCIAIGNKYDLLFIRGVTPRQFYVYKYCMFPKKFFLFVGSIKDSGPKIGLGRDKIINWILHKKRLYELKHIAKRAVMLANSPGAVKELRDKYSVNAIFCPTNTIKLNDFPKFAVKKTGQQLKLLFCGRVVPDKGIEDLLDGLGILKNFGMLPNLIVIGSVKTEYLVKLYNRAEKLGVTGQISFKGFIPFGASLFHYYMNSDIYILPSWHEGFPHSIWEAATHCVPVITTPVGGIPSLLSEDEAFFIKVHSPESIAKMILQVINQGDMTAIKVFNAYKLAQQYTSEKCALKAATIINEKMNES